MRKTIQIILLLLMFGCGGSGIEGYVNEPITITANNPEEGQDVDYFWSLAEQPDGSLINSGDLLASDYGQEMVFTPDYPGDYLIEVIIFVLSYNFFLPFLVYLSFQNFLLLLYV